jgi:ribokinase
MGVDVRAATRRDTRSRRALTLIDRAGERTIVTLGDRLAPAAADPLGWDDLDTTDTVYVTAGDPGALAHARRASCMVVTSRILRELLATDVVPDVLVGSARDPSEAVRTDRLPWRPRMIVRTEGVRGGTFETADGVPHRWEPARVTPEGDSYGAGDSFAAGLTFALGQGRSPAEAVAFAARCGAACASGRGPYAGQLTAADH